MLPGELSSEIVVRWDNGVPRKRKGKDIPGINYLQDGENSLVPGTRIFCSSLCYGLLGP